MHKLSVIIITRDEEKNIERCLKSVLWADEIVVVDSGSTDRTMAIAKKHTRKIIQREWPGYAAQKAFALDRASHDWVLSIDADEEVTEPLREEIRTLLEGEPACDGYRIPRKANFLGGWITHCGWYPDYQLRLFRKDRASISTTRRIHEGFEVAGQAGRLNGLIHHYTFTAIHQYFDTMNRYTDLHARDRMEARPGLRVRCYHFILNPLSKFLRMYAGKRGFLDGWQGFLLCWFSSIYTLVLYAKIWEMQKRNGKGRMGGRSADATR